MLLHIQISLRLELVLDIVINAKIILLLSPESSFLRQIALSSTELEKPSLSAVRCIYFVGTLTNALSHISCIL